MKDKNIALILSIIFGGFGIDRFYLGYPLIGLVKLETLGCFGILWIADIICIALGRLKPKNGEYSAESIQSCSNGAKNMLKGFASMAADKAAEQGNSMGAYLTGRVEKAVDDSFEKKDV
ncbi:TM2 domain-containing protein [Fibrobacter intestinalis]|uniref:TM2 domain-containing membrane protein YozV n=1 Tax=Fibrobacter intestinalis TaxID=28122 RepID=A0A1T4LPY1_9BACT|nr:MULTISPECIES: TM2 domain-containing protein [Fibrobacter]PBC73880.1 TM2 domain-containing membrane protein YozV [Fibrobacter sp. NR9]SJZ56697.1 TM2 domain-containing membrane protein YozV [Fibrobacter intestinalis]